MDSASSYIYIESCISDMLLSLSSQICRSTLSLVKKNRLILREITKSIAELNAAYFNEILEQQLTKDKFNFIHKSKTPLEDEWGRVTFFYTTIGPHLVLLYQPGTPTFTSSVDSNCDLATVHDNCHQNGSILGKSCACFLAKFMAHLSQTYQQLCAEDKIDSKNFHPSLYGNALDTCLEQFSPEDADAHGRLLEIKDLLLHVGGQNEIRCESIYLFYLKDIAVQRQYDDDFHQIVQNRLRISQKEFSRFVKKRDECRTYKNVDRYFGMIEQNDTVDHDTNNSSNSDFIDSELWSTMRHGILNKNNIFKDAQLARKWLNITFEQFEKHLRQCSQSQPDEQERNPSTRNTSTVEPHDLELEYALEKNEKLMEYYVQLQLGMESLFRSAVIADADIFELRSPNICTALDAIAELIPEVNLVIKGISMTIAEISKATIEKKLQELCQLSVRFPLIPEQLARKVTIMKRHYIMKLGERDKVSVSSKFDNIFTSITGARKLTVQQILAIRDTKIVEACCIKLLCNNDINPLRERNERNMVKKIVSEFKNIQYSMHLSPDLQTPTEQPDEFHRRNAFSIPDFFFESHANHHFMKCMHDEAEQKHRERVKDYLMNMSDSKIGELIGYIDPSESRLNPLLILLLEVKKEKKGSCTIL